MESAGGSLKLKGSSSVKKKKKKSTHTSHPDSASASNPEPYSSANVEQSSGSVSNLTDSEIKLKQMELTWQGTDEAEVSKDRERNRLDTQGYRANLTSSDRVQEFNSKLARLSEHNDIPRVGPG